jgi:hypothetical protein
MTRGYRYAKEDDPVAFNDCECLNETAKALLVQIPDLDDGALWIPKSQVHADSEVYEDGHTGTLVITGWFAKKLIHQDTDDA